MIREPADEAARQVVEFLAERRLDLMGGIWVHGELAGDGSLARISTEVATLARALGEASGEPVTGVVVGSAPEAAAAELARYLPRVLAVTEPATADHAAGTIVARRLAALVDQHEPQVVLAGAGPEGRDVAGVLSALTGLGVLANATAVSWTDGGPEAEHSVFGGKLITRSALTTGRGIVTVRPNVVTAEAAGSAGTVEAVDGAGRARTARRPRSSSGSSRKRRPPRSRRRRSSWPAVAAWAAPRASS